uniref:Uncharacterized protein n=1 Tax=Rhizophora mucronata TaxID=61149 RepID=A0A2P2PCU1_RHIMU
MELFPAQPDLSLQISPPNSKPTSTGRTSTEEEMDLRFWKRALDCIKCFCSIPVTPKKQKEKKKLFQVMINNFFTLVTHVHVNMYSHHQIELR